MYVFCPGPDSQSVSLQSLPDFRKYQWLHQLTWAKDRTIRGDSSFDPRPLSLAEFWENKKRKS